MINSDLAILDTLITDLDSYYRIRVQATPATVKSYFNTLIDYSVDEVADAIEAHKADVTKGHRPPLASDLLYQLGIMAEHRATERSLTSWRDDQTEDRGKVTPMPESVRDALKGLSNKVTV